MGEGEGGMIWENGKKSRNFKVQSYSSQTMDSEMERKKVFTGSCNPLGGRAPRLSGFGVTLA